MRTITERIRGETIIREETQIQGIVNGRVYVDRGGNLLHQGMIIGTVTVEKGSEANIFGFVKGDVINNGGKLTVFGTVNGTVRTESGTTKIDKDAFIKEQLDLRAAPVAAGR
jgi:hypothetical protein